MPNGRSNISLKDRHLRILEHLFQTILNGLEAEMYLYGSRAKNMDHASSDIDLAIKSKEITPVILSRMKESLHESHIPFKVDLVELDKIDEVLRKEIEKDGILIWKN